MHEMSIVETLIEQVEGEVRQSGHAGQVQQLELVVGRLSGVNVESLRFAFDALAPGTIIEGATLQIDEPPAVCRCLACGKESEIEQMELVCPQCSSLQIVVEGGRDLLLQSIELED